MSQFIPPPPHPNASCPTVGSSLLPVIRDPLGIQYSSEEELMRHKLATFMYPPQFSDSPLDPSPFKPTTKVLEFPLSNDGVMDKDYDDLIEKVCKYGNISEEEAADLKEFLKRNPILIQPDTGVDEQTYVLRYSVLSQFYAFIKGKQLKDCTDEMIRETEKFKEILNLLKFNSNWIDDIFQKLHSQFMFIKAARNQVIEHADYCLKIKAVLVEYEKRLDEHIKLLAEKEKLMLCPDLI